MRRTRRQVLGGIASAGLGISFVGTAGADEDARYVVAAGDREARRNLEREGYEALRELAGGEVLVVRGSRRSDPSNVGGVERAVRNVRLETEGPATAVRANAEQVDDGPRFFGHQWDKHVTDVSAAHDYATGDGTRIAIIDSGVADAHPDLANVNTDLSRSIVDGEVRDHVGDAAFHGTHVAGIAAATGASGVIGTAPDAELVSIRVLDERGTGPLADILTGIDYAVEIGADVVNLSLGPWPPEVHDMVRRVLRNAIGEGTVVTGAAGNDSIDLTEVDPFVLPADVEGSITVSATGPNDLRAFYSNFGAGAIDVGAPGGGYETPEKTECCVYDFDTGEVMCGEDCERPDVPYPFNLAFSTVPNGYAWLDGTSMAAPQVAGLVGLVRDLRPDLSPAEVEGAIKRGAEDATDPDDPDLGAGRINVLRTVERLDDGDANGD